MAQAEYLSAGEAATVLGVSPRTITRWLKEGHLPSVKIGRAHRIPRSAIPGNDHTRSWDATIQFTMDYPGWAVTKNGMWNAGNRRHGKNRTALDWQKDIAQSVQMGFLEKGARGVALPIVVEIRCRFKSESRAADPQNLVEIIADAIEEGTGVNDRNYQITTYPPEYDPASEAEIRISVTGRCSA